MENYQTERDGNTATEQPDFNMAPTAKEVIANSMEGIMLAADYVEESLLIVIDRVVKGARVRVLQYTVHPLDNPTMKKCRKQAMRPKWNESTGKRPELELDTDLFEALLIYNATDPADRARLWDNQEAQAKLDVTTNTAMIIKVHKPGEKAQAAQKISEFSGYIDEEALVDTAKN